MDFYWDVGWTFTGTYDRLLLGRRIDFFWDVGWTFTGT